MLLSDVSDLIRMDSARITINGEALGEKVSFPQNIGIVIENMELCDVILKISTEKIIEEEVI